MKIVVALGGMRAKSLISLDFIIALFRFRCKYEVTIIINRFSYTRLTSLPGTLNSILEGHIQLLHQQDDFSFNFAPPGCRQRKCPEILDAFFLTSLNPDIVLLAGDVIIHVLIGNNLPIVFLLHEFPLEASINFIKEIKARSFCLFITPTLNSRLDWIEQWGLDKQCIMGLSENGNDSLELQVQHVLSTFELWRNQCVDNRLQLTGMAHRPKLAFVSPLPPERSGISDYSAELLPELSRYYDIDVVVNQELITNPWIIEHCQVRSVDWFSRNAAIYHRVLYHIGNSPFHLHMFDLLQKIPGVVVLHDFFLSDILEYRDHSGIAPGSFAKALYHSHGFSPLLKLFSATKNNGDVVATYPCNFEILEHATGVILHSNYANTLLQKHYNTHNPHRIEIIPLLRSPAYSIDRLSARRALDINDNAIVVCSFGMPSIYKLSNLILDAWLASSLAENEQCLLVFVGEQPDNDFNKQLNESVCRSGKENRIRMTGWVPMEKYRLYLAAADIGVQLRTMSRGESSASALDCMNYGLATIVNANESLIDLPNDSVIRLGNKVTPKELKKALENLYADESLRKKLSINASSFVHTYRSPCKIAEHYASTIERFSQNPATTHHPLIQKISSPEMINNTCDENISTSVEKTFPSPNPQHQLFIDISALVAKDLKTGIQRVVRSVVLELLEHPPEEYRIEPVVMELGEHGYYYRYARQFTINLIGGDKQTLSLLPDEPVQVNKEDIFYGIDLCHNVRFAGDFFKEFKRNGGSVYFLLYDLLPLQYPHFFPPEIDQHHLGWFEVVAQGDGVLCISKSVAEDVKDWLDRVQPKRCQPFSIGWVHLGADIEKSIPTKGFPNNFNQELKNLSKTTTILMVGTVEPRKSHLLVLKAFELLWITGMKVNLVIVGKQGWMVEEVAKRMSRHQKWNRHFIWYQGLSDESLQKLYGVSDGVIMASEGEGFGLPLIEAAQHGCSILVRDLPVFREVAGNHATYFRGNSPLNLSIIVRRWIKNLKKGSAPLSNGMPWLTWKESSSQMVNLLTNSNSDQWLYQWMPTPANEQKQVAVLDKRRKKSPQCVAVDLTLVQPGGENGGAKVFVLELLKMLARMKPKTQFVILTRQSSHNELAYLDRRNMHRVMMLADLPPNAAETNRPEHTAGFQVRFSAWTVRTVKRWKRSIRKRVKRINYDERFKSGRTLLEMGVDLLYCPFTALEHAEPGIPTVCTVYDLQYKTYPQFFPPEEVEHRNRVFLDACSQATALTAISEYSRQSAIAHGSLDPSRIRMISLRMAHRISSGKKTHVDRNLKILERLNLVSQQYLLYPANFWEHKNHEMLLTAFEIAIRNGLPPNIKLVCTGAPTERQRLIIGKSIVMGLEGRVIFPGYLPNNELAVLLSNSRGMIFPSLYEGFGLPVIEAMTAGVPVSCSNTRALPEVTSGAALLFDPESPSAIAEAMISLTKDEVLRLRLIKDGLQRAGEFADQERMAREYWNLFEEAVNDHADIKIS